MTARVMSLPLPPGSPLGSLMTVEHVLGQGGTAVVYSARHVYFSTPVAVKVVSLRGASHSAARARLLREAWICTKLRDPRLPKVYYADQLPDGSPYIVMEKVEGTTLRAALSRGPLSFHIVASIGRHLLELLQSIHAASIVHCDIKPGNLIVERVAGSGVRLRVIDFGFSHAVDASQEHGSERPEHDDVIDPGKVVGTPSYMAPEQLTGQVVDARADLYAAGVVLYELLAGRVPIQAASMVQLVEAVSHEAPLSLANIAPSAPAAAIAVIERALEKHPDQRFATAAEMAEAWSLAAGESL